MRYVSLALLASLLAGSFSVAQAADLEKGKTLFAQRCASCHGDKGAGDGPIAASIPAEQKPRNLQEAPEKYKFAKDDAQFRELMKKGGAGVGLSILMPAQADLSDDDIDSLILFVASLRK